MEFLLDEARGEVAAWEGHRRLTGRGNGLFNLGRNIKYPKETPLANLHVAMMNQLGVPAEKFADSNGKLGYLSDL